MEGTWQNEQGTRLMDIQIEINRDGAITFKANCCKHESEYSNAQNYSSPEEAGKDFTKFLREAHSEQTAA